MAAQLFNLNGLELTNTGNIKNVANGDIFNNIENIKNNTNKVLEFNEIKDPLIKSNILMIINYVKKFPELFTEYKEQFSELFNMEGNTIRLKYNYKKYMNEFFNIIYKNADLSVHYQKIINIKGNVFFHEALLRIGGIKNFNHFDYLEIHNNFGKGIYLFYNVLDRVFNDISNGDIKTDISINVEVKDINDKNFFKIINFLKDKYGIDLSKQKIIFEVLENEKLPDTEEFKEKIIKLKSMGINIALDDILSEKVPLDDLINNIDYAGKNLDIIKIDGKMLQSFYSIYKTANSIFGEGFTKLKTIFSDINKKGVKIVAEWIEDMEMFNFAKNVLGIQYFQGFFSNKEENIKILQNNI